MLHFCPTVYLYIYFIGLTSSSNKVSDKMLNLQFCVDSSVFTFSFLIFIRAGLHIWKWYNNLNQERYQTPTDFFFQCIKVPLGSWAGGDDNQKTHCICPNLPMMSSFSSISPAIGWLAQHLLSLMASASSPRWRPLSEALRLCESWLVVLTTPVMSIPRRRVIWLFCDSVHSDGEPADKENTVSLIIFYSHLKDFFFFFK